MRARKHVLQTVLLATLAVLALAVLGLSAAEAIPTGTLVCRDAGNPHYFWLVDVPTGSATKIDVGVYCSVLRWSQDGEWLTFHGGQAYRADIYVVRPDGTGFQNLTNDSMDLFTPSFSPDGQRILFNDMAGRLYTINFDGTGRALVAGTGGMHHPQWSPVDNRIVYSNWSVTYQSDIFVYDMGSGTSVNIADHMAAGVRLFHTPTWSPDGTMVAMTGHSIDASDPTPFDIWVVSADGSGDPVNVTAYLPDSNEKFPAWSPDGEYIVCSSDIDGDYDIWAIRIDGSEPPEKLYGVPGVDEYYPAITVLALEAEVHIDPDTFNLRSRGRFITAYIELPEGYDPADIDVSTVLLTAEETEDTVPAEPRPTAVRDHDRDGVPDLRVRFDRQAVQGLLSVGEEVVVYVGGLLIDGTEFLGSDTIRVVAPGKRK